MSIKKTAVRSNQERTSERPNARHRTRGKRAAAALGLIAASALFACGQEPTARFPTPPETTPSPLLAGGHDPQQGGWEGTRAPWPTPATYYPLDSYSRALPDQQLGCPAVDARDHAGESLRFSPPAKVIEPFRQRLLAFEQVVREVSQRVYGRWPSAIRVAASYGCRSVGGANRKLSEHALGNAIDVAGFDFAAPLGWQPLAAALPVPFGSFEVRVDRHWRAKGDPASERHAYFLAELTRELVARGVFRTLLGPAQPDHHDHFHFDMAPWSYVNL